MNDDRRIRRLSWSSCFWFKEACMDLPESILPLASTHYLGPRRRVKHKDVTGESAILPPRLGFGRDVARLKMVASDSVSGTLEPYPRRAKTEVT